MRHVIKKLSKLTALVLVIGVADITSVKAEGYCCYHAGQIWMESGSARQVSGVRSEPGRPVIDAENPWRTTNKTKIRQRRQGYSYIGSPPLNYYNRSGFYGTEPVPLGLHGPVDPYLLGWGTGWPMSPMPWGW